MAEKTDKYRVRDGGVEAQFAAGKVVTQGERNKNTQSKVGEAKPVAQPVIKGTTAKVFKVEPKPGE